MMMNVPDRRAELEREYERLVKVRNEITEQLLRIDGAILILRELEVPEGEAQPEVTPAQVDEQQG